MNRAVFLSFLFVFAATGAGLSQVPECCETCSCTHCGDLAECLGSPFLPEDYCNQYNDGGTLVGCGIGATACTEWYENSVYTGTTVDSYSSTSGTNPCIPIDGGLGFLIAGGLGIGVIGIRRRNDGLKLKAA